MPLTLLRLMLVLMATCAAISADAQTILKFAGTGSPGYSGNGGLAALAKFNAPIRVLPVADGTILVVDEGNHVVRRIGVDGKVIIVAGTPGNAGFSGDGGAATAARLNQPTGVAVLANGAILIADRSNRRIRKVFQGTITTVAGNGAPCAVTTAACGDGGAATAAQLNGPDRVAVLPDGSFLITEDMGHKVRKVSSAGIISRVAGTGAACAVSTAACGDGGAATAAQLNAPNSVAVLADGSFIIADSADHRIRKISAAGIISTVAGNGNAGSWGDGVSATTANLNTPSSVAVAPDGTIVIADTYSHLVRYVKGGIIRNLAGTANSYCTNGATACGDGGMARSARLNTPFDVAVQADGSVLIADHLDNRIRVVDVAFGGAPLAHVVGRNLVNGVGRIVQLRGVNRAAFESVCTYSNAIADGPIDAGSITAMYNWEMTTVRVTINEDCWLGINGLPKNGNAAAYRATVIDYVNQLRARGFYVVLVLPLTAPGAHPSTRIDYMPDATHAPDFWRSVASAFVNDHGIIFDPIGEVGMASWNNPHPVPAGQWACYRKGCTLDSVYGGRFSAAGMQQLVNAIRSRGATQPIILGGLSYSGDQSQLINNLPTDNRNQLMAAAHIYDFTATRAFVDSQFATTFTTIANRMPFVLAELGERYCDSGTAAYTQHVLTLIANQRAANRIMGAIGWAWNARTTTSTGWTCPTGKYGEGGPLLIRNYIGTPTVLGIVFSDWFVNSTGLP